MRVFQSVPIAVLLLAAVPAVAADAPLVLQNRHLRLEIGRDAIVRSVRAMPSGVDYAYAAKPIPVAAVYRGGRTGADAQEDFVENAAPIYRGGQCFPATAVTLKGKRLTIAFAKAGVTAVYRVTTRPDYLAFELVSLDGEPVDRIDLLRLRLRRLPNLGPWINVAYDDQFGVCLCGGNLETNAGMNRRAEYVDMRAMAERDVALVGTTAVLFGCPQPRRRFLDAMEIVERDFKMPAGARNRRSAVQNYSYLWCNPTPENVEQYVDLARRSGLRMILFSYRAFTNGAGHFTFNAKYPRGMDDLKRVTGTIRAAGLKLGLHLHYSKCDRTDPYVTPVPDSRLHVLRTFTLAAPIGAETGTIPVRENPAGATMDKDRRILRLGRELVSYKGFTTSRPFRFTGCERGHLGTTASAHRGGDRAGLLDVDDWTRFIRFDQRTDIQDEVGRRIAEIANETGPYDMVYFDGAEDVHAPFWYRVTSAQYRVFRHFRHEPPVCEAALTGHFGWHFLTRSNAYDVPHRYTKSFIHEVPSRMAPVRAKDFTRIEFGWLFGLYDFEGPDVLEYVLSRAAAWDCPFSIRMDVKQVAAHPRADDCLAVIKTWEDARIGGHLTDDDRRMLRTLDPRQHQFIKVWDARKSGKWTGAWKHHHFADREHHLFVNERGKYELVEITEVPNVAEGFFRAYSFRRASQPNVAYVLLWAVRGGATLAIDIPAARLTAMRPFGAKRPVESIGRKSAVTISDRTYLALKDIPVEQARKLLGQATRRNR